MGKTLFERVWEAHVVREEPGEPALLYVDLHLIHEVTSPQAFEGLRLAGRRVRRPDLSLATMDHNVPTLDGPITDPLARAQLEALRRNCEEFGVPLYATGSGREGIVHVIGPELGVTQPGMTIVCGDSHTSTHGAFGALAFGIGTSEVEHVLATQTLPQRRPGTMRVRFEGELPLGVTAKDAILGAIGRIGVAGGVGHVIEYAGPVVRALSMEARMTLCNMSIEAGARAGMVAPDDTTFAYLEGRPGAPAAPGMGAGARRVAVAALGRRRGLRPRGGDRRARARTAGDLGDEPGDGRPGGRAHPRPGRDRRPGRPCRRRARTRLHGARARHADLGDPSRPGLHRLLHERADRGPATSPPRIVAGRRVHSSVQAMVVPGSAAVRHQAEEEGLDQVFRRAGFEWRRAGCSMCLGMNPDVLAPGERCASTSNRNFEGRQGRGGRTHLVTPAMAAAAALAGRFVDVRELEPEPVAA